MFQVRPSANLLKRRFDRPQLVDQPTPFFTVVTFAALTLTLVFHATVFGVTQEQTAAKSWEEIVKPIIDSSCLDCHAGPDADGSLDLEAFEKLEDVVDERRLWSKIASRVRDRQMPPPDGSELSDSDRDAFLNWIDNDLPTVACNHEHHAGPVTIRRLTRYEYANTVRELLKIDYPFTDKFPADEVGYGFDNIGDVLSVSPLLLEKYLAAAEDISARVIVDPISLQIDERFGPVDFGQVRGGHIRNRYFVLTTNGTISTEVVAKSAGKFDLQVTAFGQQAGDELPKMTVSVDGQPVRTVDVEPRSMSKAEAFEFAVPLEKGRNRIQVSFVNDYYNPNARNRNRRDRNLCVAEISIKGPSTLPRPSAAQQSFLFDSPNETGSPRLSAETIINRHASRAFRRKIYASEREKLLELFDLGIENGESFEGAMKLVLQAILVSPQFLYKVEAPVPDDGTTRRLSDFELATTISYFLWGSMPDDQLFRLASQNVLSEEKTLHREVKRMLANRKSVALIDNFAAQWLQLRVLQESDPDPDLFPGFTEHLKNSMLNETRFLLIDIFQKDEPLTTLLSANYTYVNRALAQHYGWSTRGLRDNEFSKVNLDGKSRQGLLSHASVLTLTSNPTRTSPVKRGKWILENLLADPPPPALPDVPQLDSQEELVGTLRERMEQHRENPACATCHTKMDSLGFALENFDGLGRFRTVDDGVPIDSKGTLPDGSTIASAAEVQALIATDLREQFIRCLTEKLFIYAVGRGPIASDDCMIEKIAKEAFRENHRFSELVTAIIMSEAFRFRSLPTD